jgi:hypothetical protein
LQHLFLLLLGSPPGQVAVGTGAGKRPFMDILRYKEHELVPGVLTFHIESGLFYFNVQNVKTELLNQAGAYPGLNWRF